ncbi:hypothetical protein AGMMS50276_29980 [Synergistales bacterium]|nr:hypothetical protein AGMMS50276_29980 [Synergistales bacterium]
MIYLGCFGEPLLNPRIIDMIHILKASKACRELRILTNGYLLSQDLNEKIVGAGADLVRVSIEGLSADDYWKFCKVKLDYDKFISNLNDLFMRSRGTATKVSAKIIAAGLESNEDLQLFQKMFSSITDTCFCENISSGWPFFESGLKKIVGAGQLTYETADEAAKHVCSYPLTHLVVFANGSVGVCCSDWRMDTVVGDLGSQSIYDIWNGEALHAFRRKHLLRQKAEASPSCGVCSMYPPDNIDNDAEKILRRLESLENYSSKVAKE